MKRIIATVGPSLLHEVPIQDVHREEYIYRINGAHGTVDDVEAHILEIRRQVPEASILVDLPGNKIRTANLPSPILFRANELFQIPTSCINYPCFFRHVRKGTLVWANDSMYEFVVESATEREISFRCMRDGHLANNKGLHVRGIHRQLPFLLEKDEGLIRLANRYRPISIGLSFVRDASDIVLARGLLSEHVSIIAKIETLHAVQNLNPILERSDQVLIDRGDLSTEVGLSKVPAYQNFIITRAHFFNRKVFLATQVLKSMEDRPLPTIAEVIDLYNSIRSGIYGIQLSEETAIGKYPVQCLDTVRMVYDTINRETQMH